MILNIENDLHRFRSIMKGRVRKDLKRFMGSGEITGDSGTGKSFSVPLPRIDMPRLRYGHNGGVGQGEGGKGDPIDGAGEGQPGDGHQEHGIELEVTLDELTAIMAEELSLPPLLPKGQQLVEAARTRYTSISRVGPNALRHGRRTFREALKRVSAEGGYHPGTVLVPRREDYRYRSGTPKTQPQAAAAVVYIMDVSGSMGPYQKEMARQTSFWLNLWLRRNFPRIKQVYIIHDAKAEQVDEHTFFNCRTTGGTLISSAYELVLKQMPTDFPPDDWNIFVFQFSDGDNWNRQDTDLSLGLLTNRILPLVNRFGYGQVNSEYGRGDYYRALTEHCGTDERVRIAEIPDRDAVMTAIRQLLG